MTVDKSERGKEARGDEPANGSLSSQEKRVLELVAKGKTNKETAIALGLSRKTVKNYLSTIFRKLQVRRRTQAAMLFREKLSK